MPNNKKEKIMKRTIETWSTKTLLATLLVPKTRFGYAFSSEVEKHNEYSHCVKMPKRWAKEYLNKFDKNHFHKVLRHENQGINYWMIVI